MGKLRPTSKPIYKNRMRALYFILFALLAFPSFGQITHGTLTYEVDMKFEIELPPDMEQYRDMIPKGHTMYKDLHFTPDASLYKESEVLKVEETDNPFEGRGRRGPRGGMRRGMGGDAIMYSNLKEGKTVTSQDFMDKTFLILSEVKEKDWKLDGGTAMVMDMPCMKATTTTEDSTEIVAWFTPQIPVSVGPRLATGLPGAILKMEFKQKRADVTITAKELNKENPSEKILEPTKGKEVTEEEFQAMVEEKMEEMKKMYGGHGKKGGPHIRISTH